ncbi:hypothetical protein MP213Fo_15610 [Pseudochrobactrum sp. MP213Fo]
MTRLSTKCSAVPSMVFPHFYWGFVVELKRPFSFLYLYHLPDVHIWSFVSICPEPLSGEFLGLLSVNRTGFAGGSNF